MKICNSCMQMTGDASQTCPVCKMAEFTSLDSSVDIRERQVKKLKKSQGIYKKPHRNIRRVRYGNSSRGGGSLVRSLGIFLAGSAILSVALNSTVWSSPGNPLDLGNYTPFEARLVGLTPLTQDEFASMGTYIFKRADVIYSKSTSGAPVVELYVAFNNKGTTPAEQPRGQFCLKTNLRHLQSSLYTDIAWAYEAKVPPNPGPWDPKVEPFEFQVLNGYWEIREDELPLEAYLGECGRENFSSFRFSIPE